MFSRPSMPNEAQAPFVAMPSRLTSVATTLLPEAEWKETDDENAA